MLSDLFVRKISDFIRTNGLLSLSEKHLVALSGGADSVVLALVMQQLGYHVEAVHCNFRLRGDESDRDERFCVKFCKERNLKLHIVHFDTTSFAEMRKISIEMAARELRYSYFRRLAEDIGAASICVAHHQDDSVETVLMNLIRGTGIHGLVGIQPKNGKIVRPLLCVSRKEIETELIQAGQEYVTDSTNLIDDVTRNKIRLDILPLMREINPSVNASIMKTAARLDDVVKVFDSAVNEAVARVAEKTDEGVLKIDCIKLADELSPEYVLFSMLSKCSFTSAQVEQIYRVMGAVPGKVFYSETHQFLVDRGRFIVEPLSSGCCKEMRVPECGTYVYNESAKFRFEQIDVDDTFVICKDSRCCQVDIAALSFPLTIRCIRHGDRFVPFGMKGSKLVSDYLTDKKMNLFDKRRQLVVTDARGEIIWLVNQRTDDRHRITDRTKCVLKITII